MDALQVGAQGFFSLSLCFDLGMVNIAIMKTRMEREFKHSFMIGFGAFFGDLFYLSLALIGVSLFVVPRLQNTARYVEAQAHGGWTSLWLSLTILSAKNAKGTAAAR
ncbi:LysE family transporter [Paenibacillus sp. FSL H7-0331]|uniref:LysE family transporter n=1 Tax=Paenibacillus sp. FSL H7-0331 TaxID=1920421 RepID=UPI002116A373|nr:LysE family transporter [Paenibacillus sp. FSL H7-0331]